MLFPCNVGLPHRRPGCSGGVYTAVVVVVVAVVVTGRDTMQKDRQVSSDISHNARMIAPRQILYTAYIVIPEKPNEQPLKLQRHRC